MTTKTFSIEDLHILKPYFFNFSTLHSDKLRGEFDHVSAKTLNSSTLRSDKFASAKTVNFPANSFGRSPSLRSGEALNSPSSHSGEFSIAYRSENVRRFSNFSPQAAVNGSSIIHSEKSVTVPVVVRPTTEPGTPSIFFPKQNNSLFWCIYIQVHGLDEYKSIKTGFSNIEFNERSKIMNFIRENPHIISKSNFKITQIMLKELMSGLLSDVKTSVLSLYLYALYYKKNIYLVNYEKNTYLEFLGEEDNDGMECKQINSFGGGSVEAKNEFLGMECKKIVIYYKNSTSSANKVRDTPGRSEGKNKSMKLTVLSETLSKTKMNLSDCNLSENVQHFGEPSLPPKKDTTEAKNDLQCIKDVFLPTLYFDPNIKYWCIPDAVTSLNDIFLNEVKQDFFKMENATKSMKSISNYKVTELEEIMKKVSKQDTLLHKFYQEKIHPNDFPTSERSEGEQPQDNFSTLRSGESLNSPSLHSGEFSIAYRSENVRRFSNFEKTKKIKKSDIYNNILSILSECNIE
jgi:hypothetical protein